MIDKLDGLSMDIEAENKNKLKSVFPPLPGGKRQF